jgi:hypothetical protein
MCEVLYKTEVAIFGLELLAVAFAIILGNNLPITTKQMDWAEISFTAFSAIRKTICGLELRKKD